MFDQVFDNVRKATEASVQMQQELFKKWVSLWPGVPASPTVGGEQVVKFQRKWAETVGELGRKQREFLEAQFHAGLRNIEEAFRLAEVKDPEQLRTRTLELWQKVFDGLRQGSETQLRDFQAAAIKWAELMVKGAA
jgi:hypothetical protein